jgi:hypothetical protein
MGLMASDVATKHDPRLGAPRAHASPHTSADPPPDPASETPYLRTSVPTTRSSNPTLQTPGLEARGALPSRASRASSSHSRGGRGIVPTARRSPFQAASQTPLSADAHRRHPARTAGTRRRAIRPQASAARARAPSPTRARRPPAPHRGLGTSPACAPARGTPGRRALSRAILGRRTAPESVPRSRRLLLARGCRPPVG